MTRRGPREIALDVSALTAEGLGEGAFEGRQVLARNALPGEAVNVRVLKRRRGIWYGEADDPALASVARRRPPCRFFPRCGGCTLQHLDHEQQLLHKQQVLLADLAAHGVAPGMVRAPYSGPRLHYRFKARLGVRVVGDRLLAGFREGFSNRVVRMDDCKTLALPFARMLPALQTALGRLRRPDQVPQVELAGGDHHHAVIVRHLTALDESDLDVLDEFGRVNGMRVYLQGAGYDSVRPLRGADVGGYLSYENADYGLSFEFLPTDFTQVNPYVNRALVRGALLGLRPRHGARAVDLFCGIGNFSLAMARSGLRVHGFEAAAGAIDRARHNACRNGLSDRAEFALADLYDARCPDLPEAEYLLLDPPRSGAGANLSRWVASPVLERIVYVSCNPRTFSSDAVLLQQAGFVLDEVGIFDMFPHTAHVETLGVFTRIEGVS